MTNLNIIRQRGELLTELFLEDLNASFIAQPSSEEFQKGVGYDLLVGFSNGSGGVNHYAVRFDTRESQPPLHYPLPKELYKGLAQLAYSNIPALLLVIDVKHNHIFYAWITPDKLEEPQDSRTINILLTEVDDTVKKQLRDQLTSSHEKEETTKSGSKQETNK